MPLYVLHKKTKSKFYNRHITLILYSHKYIQIHPCAFKRCKKNKKTKKNFKKREIMLKICCIFLPSLLPTSQINILKTQGAGGLAGGKHYHFCPQGSPKRTKKNFNSSVFQYLDGAWFKSHKQTYNKKWVTKDCEAWISLTVFCPRKNEAIMKFSLEPAGRGHKITQGVSLNDSFGAGGGEYLPPHVQWPWPGKLFTSL